MRIVIAGTQPVERAALRRLLQIKSKQDQVDEATTAADLFSQIGSDDVELVLLDGYVEGPSITELIAHLKKRGTPPIVFVLDNKPETEQMALDSGADAFFYKGEPPKRLQIAIESVRLQLEHEQRTDRDGFFR